MTASSIAHAPRPAGRGITRFALVRILLATLAVCAPVALALILVHQIPDKSMRAVWPQLLGAALAAGGYLLYVRRIERRAASELAGPGIGRELGSGAAFGAGLFVLVIGCIAALAKYQVTGQDSWAVMIKPFAEMIMVALVEEIVFRGVLFRISERSLGSWAALIISSLIFAAAHLPNEGVTLLSVGITFVAGVMFAAAYMATQRLWLAIGLHFAWNFTSDAVFSLPTSGHPAKGFLQAQLTGPDWLTGGAYGVEASAVTLVVIALAAAWFLRLAIRRGHVAPAPGKRR
jgi:membrane protease YdiL (CAAX protease family)